MSTKHQQQFAAASLAGSLSTVASSAATGNNYVPGIPQRTFPGQLNSNNRGSVDWGSHGLLAYGCQDLVVVVHVETLQVAQTFHGHTANVVVVRWSQSDDRCSFNRSRQPRLASGDIAGRVLLWSVQKTKPTSLLQLTTPQKGVLAIQFQPENEDVIAVLYAPSTLALWNIRNGQKVWSKDFAGDQLLHFVFDPFEHTTGCLLSTNSFLFVIDGLTSDKASKSPVVRKFVIGESQSTPAAVARKQSRPFDRFRSNNNKEKSNAYTTPADLAAAADIVDVAFSLTEPGIIYFVTRNEVLIMNIKITQIMGVIPNESRAPAFSQVLLSKANPEILFCLHDNGSITVRARRRIASHLDANSSWTFAIVAHTDVFKLNRPDKFLSIVHHPAKENQIAGLSSDGQLLLFEFDARPNHVPRLYMTSLLESILPSPVCIEVIPLKDASASRAYCCAIGSRTGHVQIVDLKTGRILRDFAVMDVSVRTIRWLDSRRIVAAGWDQGMPSKSAVRVLDLTTGRFEDLKSERPHNNSYILTVQVSHKRQYLAVLWKDCPLELWDLSTMTLSRSTLPTLTTISTMEWSPLVPGSGRNKDKENHHHHHQHHSDELLVLALAEGIMVNCIVHNGSIREDSRFQHRSGNQVVTSLALEKKDNLLVAGDSSGCLHFYMIKAGRTRVIQTPYGEVKRIRTSPYRSMRRFLILFAEALAIYDAETGENISVLVFPPEQRSDAESKADNEGNLSRNNSVRSSASDMSTSSNKAGTPLDQSDRVVDIEWVSADEPVCIFSDGTVRLLDMGLKRAVSSLNSYHRHVPIVSPPLLSQRDQSLLRIALEPHPGWSAGIGSAGEDEESARSSLVTRLSSMDQRTKDYLTDPNASFVVRMARIAQFYGDVREVDLWRMIALYGKQMALLQQEYQQQHQQQQSLAAAAADRTTTTTDSSDSPPRAHESTASNADPSSHETHEAGPTAVVDDDELIIKGTDELIDVWDHFDDKPYNSESAFAAVPSTAVLPEITFDSWPGGPSPDNVSSAAHFSVLAPADDVRSQEMIRTAQLERAEDLIVSTVHNNIVLSQYDNAIHLLLETPSNTENFRTDALKACLIAAIKTPQSLEQTMQIVATNLIANNQLEEGVELLCLMGRGLEGCRYLQNNGRWKEAATMAKSSLPAHEANSVILRWALHLRENGEYEKSLRMYISMGAFIEARQLLIDQKHYERAVLLSIACEDMGVIIDDPNNDHDRALLASMYVGYASYLHELGLWSGTKVYREKALAV